MKYRTELLCAIVFCLPAALAAGEKSDPELAREATAAFAGSLKSELMSAMQSGGPLAAIEVCNTRAPEIAKTVSLEKGMELSRVSLKNRNPDNAPTDWQQSVLEDFDARKMAGEDPTSIAWQDVAKLESGREYRFMKAIPTGGLCLQCHGETLDPAVAGKIEELYPDDKATGYKAGDIRGAFVVTRKVSP